MQLEESYIIPGQTWRSELAWLRDHCGPSKVHAEVGSYCGRSLYAVCCGMKPGSLAYAVDNFSVHHSTNKIYAGPVNGWVQGVFNQTVESIRAAGVYVEHLNTHSIEAARALQSRGVQLDSLWLDGSHHHDAITADIEVWLPLVKPGGLFCGHDYWANDPGVMDAVNELVPGFQVVPTTRIWYARKT